jgi:hypothetical protein
LTIAITIAMSTQTTIAACIQIQIGDMRDHGRACGRRAQAGR